MSFSTSNSKFRYYFFFSLFLIILFYSLCCIVIFMYTNIQTNKNQFTTGAYSKAKHMKLNFEGSSSPDIIFIGSSKTLYHIDTSYLFKTYHLRSYNYGLNGHFISSYPYMVEQAIKLKPKVIVISIDVQELYANPLPTKDLYLADLKVYFETRQNFKFLVTALCDYIAGFNSIRQHSATIYRFITEKYNSMIQIKFKNTNIINYQPPKLLQDLACNQVRLETNTQMKNKQELNVIQCPNGDGILQGTVEPSAKRVANLNQMNNHSIELLKYILNIIKRNQIIPIVVLSPSYSVNYIYDEEKIQKVLKIRLIDLTNQAIPQEYWANSTHLNYKGREFFTKALYHVLNNSNKRLDESEAYAANNIN